MPLWFPKVPWINELRSQGDNQGANYNAIWYTSVKVEMQGITAFTLKFDNTTTTLRITDRISYQSKGSWNKLFWEITVSYLLTRNTPHYLFRLGELIQAI